MTRALPLLALALLAACNRAPEAPAPAPSTSAPSPAPSAAAAPATDLTRYVGHYPFDRVGGTTFATDPAVRRAVEAAVPDAALRTLVLGEATANPIALADGRVVAWACEPHNCGPHNWSVAITPDGRDARLCHYDQDGGIARWYPRDAAVAPVNGCPSPE